MKHPVCGIDLTLDPTESYAARNFYYSTFLTAAFQCLVHKVDDLVKVHRDIGLRHIDQLSICVAFVQREDQLALFQFR